jgi:thioesterase domain-containing protein
VHLIGYSFGGLIALEMAIQLQKRNKQLLSLTLIDTVAPKTWRTLIDQIDFKQRIRYFIANQKRKLLLFSGQRVPPSLRNDYILHSWRKAAYRYSPQPGCDTMNFFLIRSKHSLSEEPKLGWEDWPVFNPEITIIDGNHHSIIRQKERVIQLAEWMKKNVFIET